MKSKFDILFEEVMSTIAESIASRVDELAISGPDKEAIKKFGDVRKQNAAIYLFSRGAVRDLAEFERVYAAEPDYMKLSSRDKAESFLSSQSGSSLAKLAVKKFDPASEPAFSSPYDAGDGVTIYMVDKSEAGHVAVRKAADAAWRNLLELLVHRVQGSAGLEARRDARHREERRRETQRALREDDGDVEARLERALQSRPDENSVQRREAARVLRPESLEPSPGGTSTTRLLPRYQDAARKTTWSF